MMVPDSGWRLRIRSARIWVSVARVALAESLPLKHPRIRRMRAQADELAQEGATPRDAVKLARELEFRERWGQRRKPRWRRG
jgi:hypothetical protein